MPRRLDIVEISQEAAERAGVDFRAGYALTTARRSLELLQLEWANRGINLWTLDDFELPLLAGMPTYVMPADTIDVLDIVLRNWDPPYDAPHSDRLLYRIPLGDWPSYVKKEQPGPPSGVLVERTDPMRITPWPTPDRDGTLICYRLRYMEELPIGGAGTLDMPVRFIPAIIAGLAYQLCLKSKNEQRTTMLKALYEAEFDLAAGEDRDRSSVFFIPNGGYWR